MLAPRVRIEWPTWGMLGLCYGLWLAGTWFWRDLPLWLVIPLLILCVTLHSSLQHEVLHGHPTRNTLLNELLVFAAPGLFIPYRRFRKLHLQHHNNTLLTDPYDDPESWYFAEGDYERLEPVAYAIFRVSSTLLGRLLLGPALGVVGLYRHDLRRWRAGEREIAGAYIRHLFGLAPIIGWLLWCDINLALYLIAVAYPGMSLLMIRTFAEHRATEDVEQRSVIVEQGGVFSLLFLNNNLHYVHHERPRMAWYELPDYFRQNRQWMLDANGSYVYRNYWQQMLAYGFRAKEPLMHPFLRRKSGPG